MSKQPDLKFILKKIGPGHRIEDFTLFVCRGEGRGCSRNKYRKQKAPCEDCVAAEDHNETLEHLMARIERGDA